VADKGSYSIRVKLVDEATSKLAKINAELKKSAAPFEKFNRQASQFGKLTGITQATNKLKSLTDGALKAGLAVAGIAGIGTLAGLAQMTQEFAASGMQLTNMSKSLGIATGKLYEMQNAAKLSGISGEAMASSMKSIQNTMNDAKWGKNISALRAFSIAGVDVNKDSVEAVQDKVADTLLKHKKDWSAATQRDFLNLIGVGEDMLPALQDGSAAWEKQKARAKYLTGDDAAASGKKMADAFNEATLAGLGLKNALMTELEPVITPLINQARDLVLQWRQWIDANKGVIASKVQEYLKVLKDWLPEIVFGFKALVALRVASFFYGIATSLLAMNPLVLAAGAAVLAWAQAYHSLSAAYDDWKQREDYEKSVKDLKSSNDDRYSHLTPEQRARVDAWHRQNNGGKGFGASAVDPMTAQKLAALPTSIGGYKNNNPTNLAYVAGQPFVSGQKGRWGVYASPAAGLAAGLHQMLLDQDRGYNTITKELYRRSPPTDNNNTSLMISRIAAESGLDPNKEYNLRDPVIAKKFLAAVTHGGESNPTPSAIDLDKAVGMAYSIDPINKYAGAVANASGNIGVNVNVSGNHPATTQVITSGNAMKKQTVVAQSMPGPMSP
jgi:hypothetical protein